MKYRPVKDGSGRFTGKGRHLSAPLKNTMRMGMLLLWEKREWKMERTLKNTGNYQLRKETTQTRLAMKSTFRRAVYRAQINWPYWEGTLLFSDVVGYYARQIAQESKRPRRRRIKKRIQAGVAVNYTSRRSYTSEVWVNDTGRVVRESLKDERIYTPGFFTVGCDTTNYFAEGRNWPQRKVRAKGTKEAYRRIANDARAECRQRVYC